MFENKQEPPNHDVLQSWYVVSWMYGVAAAI